MGNGSLRIKKNAEKARERKRMKEAVKLTDKQVETPRAFEKEFQRGDTFKEMEEGKVFKKSKEGMGYDHYRYKEDGTTEKDLWYGNPLLGHDLWYDGSWEYTGNTGETIRLINPSKFSNPLLGHRANNMLRRSVDKNPVNLTYDQLNKIKDQFTPEEYEKIMFRKGMGEGPQE